MAIDSEQYIAVLPFCLSLKPNPLQGLVVATTKSKSADLLIFTRSVRILAPNLVDKLAGMCVSHHLKLKPRWLSLEYYPPNRKILLTVSQAMFTHHNCIYISAPIKVDWLVKLLNCMKMGYVLFRYT